MHTERIQQIAETLDFLKKLSAQVHKSLENYLASLTLGHDPSTLARKWQCFQTDVDTLKRGVDLTLEEFAPFNEEPLPEGLDAFIMQKLEELSNGPPV